MAVLATVQFAHREGALVHTLGELPEMEVRVLREAGTDPEHGTSLFMFSGKPLELIEATLDADPSVAATHPMPNYQGTHVYGIEFTPDTELLAPLVTEERGLSLEARRTDPESGMHGWWERWLFPARSGLNTVWERARSNGFEFRIDAINEFQSEGSASTGALTPEQRETLLFAFEQGYFKEPRETSLEELADRMELSSTAVGGRIRRGVNALVRATVVKEASDTTTEE